MCCFAETLFHTISMDLVHILLGRRLGSQMSSITTSFRMFQNLNVWFGISLRADLLQNQLSTILHFVAQ